MTKVGHWKQAIVDVLIAASMIAVAFAAGEATANVRDLLILGASVIVAFGLMFEPDTVLRPPTAHHPRAAGNGEMISITRSPKR